MRRRSWNQKKTMTIKNVLVFSSAHSKAATLVESLRGLIDNSQVGPLLADLRQQPYSAHAYLMDFVHMVYKLSSDVEHEVFVY